MGARHSRESRSDRAERLPTLFGDAVLSHDGRNSMQAMFVQGVHPDAAFLSKKKMAQSMVVQKSKTVKNDVNVKKDSLAFTQKGEKLLLKFKFDATVPCTINVYFIATEIIAKNGSSTFTEKVPLKIPLQSFPIGLGQDYDQCISSKDHPLDLKAYTPEDWTYNLEEPTYTYPIVIEMIALSDKKKAILKAAVPVENPKQLTYVRIMKQKDEYVPRVIKQKIRIEGENYELQEIYGMKRNREVKAQTNEVKQDEEDESDDEDEDEDNAECVICLTDDANTTLLPCRHLCLCKACAETINGNKNECPVCRTRVQSFLVFTPEQLKKS